MRVFIILTSLFITFAFLAGCNGQESSAQNSSEELEENEVIVTVDGEEWSTTNVRLAGSDVFGMRGSGEGTFGITVNVGYGLEDVGTITNNCEYSRRDRDGNSNEWTDENCTIEITTFNDDEIQGTFRFAGANDDGSERTVSGIFRVERMTIR